MIYRIDEHAKAQALLLFHAYGSDIRLHEASRGKSLRLLYEGVNPDAIKQDIVNTKNIMKKIISILPKKEGSDMIAQLQKLANAIPDPSKIEAELFAGDDAKLKEVTKSVTTNTGNAVRAAASIANGLQMVSKALQPYLDELSSEELDRPIEQLFKDKKMKNKFMPKDKFLAGVQKAFIPDKGFESSFQKGIKAANTAVSKDVEAKSGIGKMFQKISNFFAGFTFKKSSIESFPDLFKAFQVYLTKAKIKDVIDLGTKIKTDAGKLLVSAAEDAAAAGAQVAAAAGGADVEGGDKKDQKTDATPAGGAQVAANDPKLANQIAGKVDNPEAAAVIQDIGKGTDPKQAAQGLDAETKELLKALLAKLGAEGGGADPGKIVAAAEKEAGGTSDKKTKVKADDLEKAIGDKNPDLATAIAVALLDDEKTKDLLENRMYRNGKMSLRFMLSETVTYDEILKVVTNADPALKKDSDQAAQYAAKVTKFLKSKNADVDDKGAPEVKEEEGKGDTSSLASVESSAEKQPIGNTFDEMFNFIGKEMFKNDPEVVKSLKDFRSSLKDSMTDAVGDFKNKFRKKFDEWAESLPEDKLKLWDENDEVKEKIGDIMKKAFDSHLKFEARKRNAKLIYETTNVSDIFLNESSNKSQNEQESLNRWQKLAGIK